MLLSILSFVVVFTAREHFKTSDADKDTCAGQFKIMGFTTSWIFSDNRFCTQIFDKVEINTK